MGAAASALHQRLQRLKKGRKYRTVPDNFYNSALLDSSKINTNNRRIAYYGRNSVNAPVEVSADITWFEFLIQTELCTMNYDALSLSDDDRFDHMTRMMENLLVPSSLNQSAATVTAFVLDIVDLMRASNSYHNYAHVTDVTQYLYTLLLATHLTNRLAPVELAAAFTAAACHDLDHPGLSNAYQNTTASPLSLRYSGQSPLEKHHLSCCMLLVNKHGLLGAVDKDKAERFKAIVSEMILATDMAHHMTLKRKIEAVLADPGSNPMETDDGVNLVLAIALKCADISNQARPWAIANKWNTAVYGEFYVEGDLERTAKRPVAPLYDRTTNDIPKSTGGFIKFIVAPLFECYVKMIQRCAQMNAEIDSTAVEECLVFLNKNMDRYHRQIAGEFVALDELEEELQFVKRKDGEAEAEIEDVEAPKKTALIIHHRDPSTLPGLNGRCSGQQTRLARLQKHHRTGREILDIFDENGGGTNDNTATTTTTTRKRQPSVINVVELMSPPPPRGDGDDTLAVDDVDEDDLDDDPMGRSRPTSAQRRCRSSQPPRRSSIHGSRRFSESVAPQALRRSSIRQHTHSNKVLDPPPQHTTTTTTTTTTTSTIHEHGYSRGPSSHPLADS